MNRFVCRVGSFILLAGLLAGCAAPRDERVDVEVLGDDGVGSPAGAAGADTASEDEGEALTVITYRTAPPPTGRATSEPESAPTAFAAGPVPDPWSSGPVPDPWTSGPVPDPWTTEGSTTPPTGSTNSGTPTNGSGGTNGKPTP